ncbi:MAG: tripartite tricarboxylate transporter substrate binding protein [Burkholderiales bacterium]|nr:tripartite tricarboxylate transporter substrate binding protein [Burkholderiales bacterium]
MNFRKLAKPVLAAALLLASAAATGEWPEKPIRLVVPYAAGGGGDTTFRPLMPVLETRFGLRFVIDNKAGASGNIGAADVARAAPDGYTLLLGASNNFVINPFLYRDMGFDPLKAFAPITVVSNSPSVVAVNTAVPANSLRALAEYARANPGRLNYGSPGTGTPAHLAAEFFSHLAGVKMVHVPFKGSPPAVLALLQNEVQVYFTPPAPIANALRGGKVKPLAVAMLERLSTMPEVPTTKEAGFEELQTGNWWGFVAPAGTASAILDRLQSAVQVALTDATVRKRYAEQGTIAIGNSRAEFAAMLKSESVRWKRIIDIAGVGPQ